MTIAEIIILVAGCLGIYVLLRPLERWLEGVLLRRFFTRQSRFPRTTIDVTDFRSYTVHKEDHDEHDS